MSTRVSFDSSGNVNSNCAFQMVFCWKWDRDKWNHCTVKVR